MYEGCNGVYFELCAVEVSLKYYSQPLNIVQIKLVAASFYYLFFVVTCSTVDFACAAQYVDKPLGASGQIFDPMGRVCRATFWSVARYASPKKLKRCAPVLQNMLDPGPDIAGANLKSIF